MPLDDLVSVIETLKQRIRDHGDSLRQNETRTRMALIDPLLTALGWDVAEPGLVTAEYSVGGGRADYALLGEDNRPRAFIEAKHLGEPLEATRYREQVFTYALMQQVRYASLTDGDRWVLDNVSEFSGGERRLLEISVSNAPAYECALKFLLLWRPNLVLGQPMVTERPIFGADSEENPISHNVPAQLVQQNDEHWTALAELQSVTNMSPPSSVRLPDGEEKAIDRWWNVPFEVAEWHIKTGRLTSSSCPIQIGISRYLVSTSPNHSNGTPFNQARQLSQGLFLDTPYDANGLLNGAKFLIEHCGGDLGTVWLKFP